MLPAHSILREKSVCFLEWCHKFGTFCPTVRVDEEGGFHIRLSATKPAWRLRSHDTQSQTCFPAASNAIARPGKPIFSQQREEAYNTLHLKQSSVPRGKPFGQPGHQNRLNISHFFECDTQPLFVVSSPVCGLRVVP